MFLEENDVDKVDDLSEDKYKDLLGMIEFTKDEDGQKLADQAAEAID